MMSDHALPVLFVSHGNPMLALDQTIAQEYGAWGQQLPKPKAALMFSAHWEAPELMFGEAMQHDELIYDFYGFADALYQLQYPAPGVDWLPGRICELLGENVAQTDRGLDHGVWVPLLHLWPKADVPILQMSVPSHYSNQQLFDLGRRLAPLRKEGVMIMSGGTLTHNLREGLAVHHEKIPDWAYQFDQWVEHTLLNDRSQLLAWETSAPEALRNHPTAEHFRPLLITVGAAGEDEPAQFPMLGFDMAVFSKRSVQFG